ncbi:TCP-1 chaperonin subunit alpha [Giardia muris]|uniref:TCP-1 chaperonin subunit alpha n=1 Tax=Giardia muris TaxID=5742 RepID=A0A4Z1SNI0_GIAMU|nr:TCP-1 chaperonin subunit alpha [Giardia muris]|eukprot:TNJ27334.1 TCP-1 chaperonin subunit alpha [Giardia muris]
MLSQTIFLPGEYKTGAEVRGDNIAAAKTLAGIVRTTLGPTGLDKMLIDRVGEVTVTNDGATILQKLDVEHPAAKILVELSTLQDREVGDGTTSVVIYAAELLKLAEDLTLQKVHPTKIIDGYQLALRKALNYIEKRLRIESSTLTRDELIRVAQTSMSSKIIGLMPDHFAGMVVDAVTAVKHTLDNEDVKYPVKAIGILKAHGGSLRDSELIHGFALSMSRASLQMPASITDARIALIDFNLQQQRLAVGTQVLIKDVSQMEGVRQMESDIAKTRIDLLLAAGVNVILSAGSIDEMAQKYLVEAGIFGARRIPLDDLKRIAKVVGGEIISSLADLEGGETLPQDAIGHAEVVVEERLADDSVIFIKGGRGRRTGSIVLRGPTLHMLDEVGRSVHDALCAVSKALECGSVVAGGGSVETALSTYLEELSRTIQGKEQLAVAAFGRALLAIPRQLAVNAALDATELVAKLRSAHARAQLKETPQDEKDDLRHYGLDLQGGGVRNNARAGVLEPTTNKVRSLSFAVEAAVTILRIDDSIRLSPEKPPEYDGPA